MERPHYAYLDFMRILCAFAVVVLHTVSISMTCAGSVITSNGKLACEAIYTCMNFAVPVFLMITGTLFLGSDREYRFRDMMKYIRRVLFCILLFGLFFSLLEQYFTAKTLTLSMIPRAFLDIISGHLWDHMWYLYLLPGVYLLIPVIKKFKLHSSKKEYGTLTAIVFIFTYVFPAITQLSGLSIGFPFAFNSGLFLYVLLGGLLADYVPKKSFTVLSAILTIVFLGGVILTKVKAYSIETEYDSLLVFALSVSVFVLLKGLWYKKEGHAFGKTLARATFGIYIIHPLFLNFLLKALHINPLLMTWPIAMTVFTCLVTFAFSFLCVFIALKIKPIHKYLL